ncbi:hypothetical protein DUI87_04685 [Hirundo rustica rustica]|uniref:Uncharacterized protein n=1 Tax=Hirundo rustica rustica TaxID=333673 RepID=A0A3M0KZP9_HIRRU|nr:hypothetical protein DUI87_04685 [Hirundo rustica rustica]
MDGCRNPKDPAQSNALHGLSFLQLLKLEEIFAYGGEYFEQIQKYFSFESQKLVRLPDTWEKKSLDCSQDDRPAKAFRYSALSSSWLEGFVFLPMAFERADGQCNFPSAPNASSCTQTLLGSWV